MYQCSDTYQCSICYNSYNPKNSIPIILIPCSHSFCSKCIYDLHSYGYNKCSLCRGSIDYIEINVILYEIISNRNKSNNKLQQILTTKIREIINSNMNHSIRGVLFNEFFNHYTNLDTNNSIPSSNTSNTSNTYNKSNCCILC